MPKATRELPSEHELAAMGPGELEDLFHSLRPADHAAALDWLTAQMDSTDDALKALDGSITTPRPLASDQRKLDKLQGRRSAYHSLINAVETAQDREARINAAIAQVPRPTANSESNFPMNSNSPIRTRDPLVYRSYQDGGEHSFARDLFAARTGDGRAAERLGRHAGQMADLRGAIDTDSDSAGAFVPPQHLQDQWAELARPGRPFANAIRSLPLPESGMTLHIPKVTTGTLTGSQDGENTGLANRDAESENVEIPVNTIGGYADISRQAVDRSDPGLDEVLFADLARDYAMQLDSQLLTGTGNNGTHKGALNNSDRHTITWTEASPSVGLLYARFADAGQRIATTRFLPASGIFMHPRRWAWHLAALDEQDRPLVSATAPANAIASFDQVASENLVGSLQGLPVFTDAQLPTTSGTGTNQDEIIVARLDDLILWEGLPAMQVFESQGSDTLTVRFRLFAYSAYTTERYSDSLASISGTGLVPPNFATTSS